MTAASEQFGWDLKLGEVATIWRGGCIIRARFLDRISEAYDAIRGRRRTCCSSTTSATPSPTPGLAGGSVMAHSVEIGVPVPAFSSSLAYYDGYRRGRGPANMIQGLRDYFGAHTYRRVDRDGSYHARWGQDGSEVRTDGLIFPRR